jgi:DNA-binding NarL/FixJ family response regulator
VPDVGHAAKIVPSWYVRVLIVDDDVHVRAAIRLLLEQEASVSSVSECATVDCLVEQVAGFRPDAVLIDWDLPGLQPTQDLARMRASAPKTAVVALSCSPEQQPQALRAGAASFVCKGDAPDRLLTALRNLGGAD